ncbi:16S rRNA (adenine(1518)-N(6)/adenine(1519)-N(6))-dimethyltransferase RsmA [Bacteroidales bacterium OttesenSCG-928-K22]|nr:16S rRNA (adenine(1518)-N(6)/adenine(1519)-N(6))-dimethyltransferase RsmA [Bacteroidales bacterium OttesenSCG-928-L14]MDL2240603.1 16S rRNA (adenine(1518)-N(6)/adenine(1519)-N(6))-dimethyltransferase RsmA [Bacteroidales bacterium OttesenSCG-928-K22]
MKYVSPKKHLGQHFLIDNNIAERICDSLPEGGKNVLEIGPGKGVLTDIMLLKKVNFKAIDIDKESVEYLHEKYHEYKDKIILGDFLKMNLDGIFDDHVETHDRASIQFQLLGNFPYNISSQILFKVLDYKDNVDCVVGMFQKEVAQRIISPPGSKVYGILSVLIQAWYDCEYLFTVNEGSFFPPPKVKSGVIRLTRNNTTDLGVDEKLFKNVVKTAFNQRRKTLRNSLKSFRFKEDNEIMQKRPEQLSWQEFVEICLRVEN